MRSYLQALFRAEPGVDDALAERLAARASSAISRMLVWDATPPAPAEPADNKAGRTPKKKASKKGAPAKEPVFDPYEFSAMVVYAKKGADALLKKLKAIEDPAHLKQIADAQHIGLKAPIDTPDQLRAAIVEGAKQRLADRRAAAS